MCFVFIILKEREKQTVHVKEYMNVFRVSHSITSKEKNWIFSLSNFSVTFKANKLN